MVRLQRALGITADGIFGRQTERAVLAFQRSHGILVDGEVAGAINRRPGSGEIRSNLAAGGTAEATELTDTEREICAALGPELKRRGLLFVGIDVIGGRWLTEINVTSPTGIVAVDKFNGSDTSGMIWDAIEARVAGQRDG